MADVTVTVGRVIPTKFRDMGDGTFAEVINSSANVTRATEVYHRQAITTADTLAVPGALTLSAVTEAGSTLANVAYHVLVSAGNRWGPTGPGADPGTITPTASQAIRCTIPQVTGADYYDIFLSTAAAPLWVGRITETQRAAGGFIISTVGTTTAGGGAGVGQVDLGIVGTGVASTAAPFNSNTALTPASIASPIDCTGYSNALLLVKITPTDLRALPTIGYRAMVKSVLSTGDWFSYTNIAAAPLASGASSGPLELFTNVGVFGAKSLVVVLSNFSAQVASVDVWVALI